MLRTTEEIGRIPYDLIAKDYDDAWTPHVRVPQIRLTKDLKLQRGERVLDLGCGTGVDTIEMLREVAPGEVVAVDSSPAMLRVLARRADDLSASLTSYCSPAERAIFELPGGSFDIVSLRFCLAYLPWRPTLATLGRLLCKGGRLGLLTNLASSTPQPFAIYRQMANEFSLPDFEAPVPDTLRDIEEAIGRGGLKTARAWVYRLRLWFPSGQEAVKWMRESGYATHPDVDRFDPGLVQMLAEELGDRLERQYAESEGVPLDFDFAGVVGVKA